MHQVSFAFDTGAATHRGCVRDHNEDSFLARPASGLWLVADGMGGHKAGDFASHAIAESAQWTGFPTSAMDLKNRFIDRLVIAHEDIRQQSAKLDGATVGATVVALLAFDQHFACISHVIGYHLSNAEKHPTFGINSLGHRVVWD